MKSTDHDRVDTNLCKYVENGHYPVLRPILTITRRKEISFKRSVEAIHPCVMLNIFHAGTIEQTTGPKFNNICKNKV